MERLPLLNKTRPLATGIPPYALLSWKPELFIVGAIVVIHFSPLKRTLLNSGNRPAGLSGSVSVSKDAIERSQNDQCGCDGQLPESRNRAIAQFAKKVQDDPILMRKLGRRVYELMQADLMLQRERNWNYGARR